ncbi:Hypothetical predicted protein [Octopus vulgaris]|uniref:Uncharacterized protein n=1 Tax=Octopus vulgaris TaxID=6645 RepID=A0AA36BR90_OCTVU|nr:Hypothetical predicted protein [Octopus vulgaris]
MTFQEIEESQWNSCIKKSRTDLTPFHASIQREMTHLKEDTQDIVKSQLITGYTASRRSLTEAHIPGYTGYIPKIKATDTGLGCRYHSSNSIALKQFWSSRLPKEQNLGISNKSDTGIYRIEGMIPHYTGYLPQRRYRYGNTYGDTCRSLEVCSRQKICFDPHGQQIRPFSVIF